MGLTMSVILQVASPQQANLETIGARQGEDSGVEVRQPFYCLALGPCDFTVALLSDALQLT